ncbi:hypothetical protein [Streptacidiphilus sp. MAP5-3]|uniref:hypothetical protein n=1 Tax=unclassified Streptacidiphilus TaxID=2643834 RepID=UPI0035153BE7
MNDQRTLVAGLLARIYVPLTSDDAVLCLQATGAQSIEAGEVEDLLVADLESFQRGDSQTQWICPALSGDGGTPEDEYITLSGWPLRSRIVFGVLSEAQELMLLRQFCDLAISALEGGRLDGELGPMVERIEGLTIHFDEAGSQRYRKAEGLYGKLAACREVAEDAYPAAMRREKAARDAAVGLISQLGSEEILFGVRE